MPQEPSPRSRLRRRPLGMAAEEKLARFYVDRFGADFRLGSGPNRRRRRVTVPVSPAQSHAERSDGREPDPTLPQKRRNLAECAMESSDLPELMVSY